MAENRSQATDARERILCAVESLFMEQGYAPISPRVITAKARVDLAAVNYHLRSKEELIRNTARS